MQHDPIRAADTNAWLRKAAGDLRAAEHGLTASPPILDAVVFHCQQAAEKTMKGFLTWWDRSFRKIHNLEEIGEACLKIDPSLKDIVDRAVPLTEYAWKFRYPGEPEEPSLAEAKEAFSIAREVYGTIIDRLPDEVRP